MLFMQSSCLKSNETDDTVLFVGTEQHFKFVGEVLPDDFIDIFEENVDYDYMGLYSNSFMATSLESCYRVEQEVFIEYDTFLKNHADKSDDSTLCAKLSFFNQNNYVLQMEMIIDTVLPSINDNVKYHYYEKYSSDTLYVIGEKAKNGRFMMYGMTNCQIKRAMIDTVGAVIDNNLWEYNYPAWTIIVGEKVDDGINDISCFECVADNVGSYYPYASIRAWSDSDDFSAYCD